MNNPTLPTSHPQYDALSRMLRNEQTEALVYRRLAAMQKNPENAKTLRQIASDETRHASILSAILGLPGAPNRPRAFLFTGIAHLFGLSFGLRLMERGEGNANRTYAALKNHFPQLRPIADEEQAHEIALLAMLDDERLAYMGAIVLGLNDALVELTGALAGFTFALPNPRLVAITGLITGLSASMSMAASGYLSTREEKNPAKPPLKSALYTGAAYVFTVLLLVAPFFLLPLSRPALALTLATAFLIIALFNSYIAVARDEPFWPRFLEMSALSGGVAIISFLIGLALNRLLPSP